MPKWGSIQPFVYFFLQFASYTLIAIDVFTDSSLIRAIICAYFLGIYPSITFAASYKGWRYSKSKYVETIQKDIVNRIQPSKFTYVGSQQLLIKESTYEI